MPRYHFNTLDMAKRLESAGFRGSKPAKLSVSLPTRKLSQFQFHFTLLGQP